MDIDTSSVKEIYADLCNLIGNYYYELSKMKLPKAAKYESMLQFLDKQKDRLEGRDIWDK